MTELMSSVAGAVVGPERDVAGLRAAAAEAGAPLLAVIPAETELVIAWANGAALDLLGLEREDVLNQPLSAVEQGVAGNHPEWAALVRASLSAGENDAVGTWQAASVSLPFAAPSAVQLRITEAGSAGWIVALRPVSDATQAAEEAQRESEHRFTALAEHAPVGIILSEAGVRLGYVNARFAEITGCDVSSLQGTRWLDCVHSEDLAALLEAIDEVLDGFAVELTLRLTPVADGQRWVQIRLAPVSTPRRSAGFIGTVEDITARRSWEAQLAYQAGHDALTGLVNRRRLTETLNQLLTSRRRRDREAAVLFCDLDGFKEINDTLGHDAGDRVLIEVGQRLSAAARDHDVVARIAGDEFVVLIRQVAELADAEAAAARHLAALDKPIRVAGKTVSITTSIGLAMAADFDTAAALLHAADRGMYEAKRAGRGLYRVTLPSRHRSKR